MAAITDIEQAIDEFRSTKDDVVGLNDLFASQQGDLENICFGCVPGDDCPGAPGSLDPFASELDSLVDLSDQLDITANAALNLTSCQRVNQIYIDLVHDGICQDSINANVWTFSASVAISFCALFIMTFRAGIYPVEDLGFFEKKDTYDQDEGSFEDNPVL